jgi:imidazolonepropionase
MNSWMTSTEMTPQPDFSPDFGVKVIHRQPAPDAAANAAERLGIIGDGGVATGSQPGSSDLPRFEALPSAQRGSTLAGGWCFPVSSTCTRTSFGSGDRATEPELRRRAPHMEIMDAGGDRFTVKQTRQAVRRLRRTPRLDRMLAYGTTTPRLRPATGWKPADRMLDAILRLDAEGPLDLAPTFLGAHAVPPEYSGRAEAYVDLLCDQMLPAVRTHMATAWPGRPPFVGLLRARRFNSLRAGGCSRRCAWFR